MTTPHIVFGVANYGPLWAPAVESWLRCGIKTARQCAIDYAPGLPIAPGIMGTGITDRMYTSSAENRLTEGFLAQPEATHLFFTEIDMILPETAILDLLALDKDIASGVYFLREGWGQPCLYKQVVKYRRRRRLGVPTGEKDWTLYAHSPVTVFPTTEPFKLGDMKASGVPGFGCVLIKREVFEKMTPPWFEIREGKCGSDMYFYYHACTDAKAEVWVHPGVMCNQIDYTIFSLEDYYDRLHEDPAYASSGYIIGSQRYAP